MGGMGIRILGCATSTLKGWPLSSPGWATPFFLRPSGRKNYWVAFHATQTPPLQGWVLRTLRQFNAVSFRNVGPLLNSHQGF
jgi:hypothetical protein